MKPIPNFPGYQITRDGRVWSTHKWRGNGRWKSLWIDTDGYYHTTLYTAKHKRKDVRIHRLILETYIGPCPKGKIARHLNGNPTDNRLKNLCWGTHKENTQDSIKHGTAYWSCNQYGENNPANKLTEDQVRLIFHAYHDGAYTQQELADYFGVARSLIGLICQKKRWGCLWV